MLLEDHLAHNLIVAEGLLPNPQPSPCFNELSLKQLCLDYCSKVAFTLVCDFDASVFKVFVKTSFNYCLLLWGWSSQVLGSTQSLVHLCLGSPTIFDDFQRFDCRAIVCKPYLFHIIICSSLLSACVSGHMEVAYIAIVAVSPYVSCLTFLWLYMGLISRYSMAECCRQGWEKPSFLKKTTHLFFFFFKLFLWGLNNRILLFFKEKWRTPFWIGFIASCNITIFRIAP